MDRFGIGAIPWLVDKYPDGSRRAGLKMPAAKASGLCFRGISLRFRGRQASVKIDINQVFFDMTKVAVVEIEGCMASSAAITYDVVATANRISAAKRVPPFKVTTVRCGSRRGNADLRG